MRSRVLTVLLGIPVLLCAQESLTETHHFGVDPGHLRMFQFIPDRAPARPSALVVVLHGCGQSAQAIAELTGWNKLAAIHDLIVIYPQQRSMNNGSRCFNWFKSADTNKDEGEVRSIREMVRFAIENWNIDTTRIHVVGYSAGAAMTVALLADYPDVFSGGAAFAGTAYQVARTPREGWKALRGKDIPAPEVIGQRIRDQHGIVPGPFPRLVVVQGLEDKVVPPRNAHLLFDQWRSLYNGELTCGEDQPIHGSPAIRRTKCSDPVGDERIVLYEIEGVGHQIMVDPGDRDDQGGRTGRFAVHGAFHSTHRVAIDLRIIDPQ